MGTYVHYADRVRGSLLGGALGDALGWPVEFQRLDAIRDRFGPAGTTALLVREGGEAEVTDDTQMTLFTAEGLLRGGTPEAVREAHGRWLLTQRLPAPERQPDGWLLAQPFLYASRAPGNACMSGLTGHPYRPAVPFGTPGTVNPDSKGCGTVMRSAPFGLVGLGTGPAFDLAARCAQQTHGHPTGYLAAGAFAALLERVCAGVEPRRAVEETIVQTAAHPGSEETVQALLRALRLVDQGAPSPETVEQVGLGWIAEECLAIAVYCALAGADARAALVLSVNHSGDSDSAGAVCGNLVGAMYGVAGLPADWLAVVEGRDVVRRVADDLLLAYAYGAGDRLADRYPPAVPPAPTTPAEPTPPPARPRFRSRP